MTAHHALNSDVRLAACFAVAVVEGYDIQVVGIAAGGIARSLSLAPSEIGWLLSIGTAGLALGAWLGGRLADRFGRRRLVMACLLVFGLASIGTAAAVDAPQLFAGRFLTGLGLGGALPAILVLAAPREAVGRVSRLTLIYAGLPLGGALVTAVALLIDGQGSWRWLLLAGGLLPLFLIPVMAGISDPTSTRGSEWRPPPDRAGNQMSALMLACAASLVAMLLLHILLNWLPQLLLGRGLAPADVLCVQLAFNLFGALGGVLVGKVARQPLALGVLFACVAVALLSIATLHTAVSLIGAGALLGFGVLAGQAALHALIPPLFPDATRATGTGTAVAFGRLGAFVGPALVAGLLVGGILPDQIIGVLAPLAIVAGVLTARLAGRPEGARVCA